MRDTMKACKPGDANKKIPSPSLTPGTGARIGFLGLIFDRIDLPRAAQRLAARARANDAFVYVIAPNVEQLVRLTDQPELHPVYRGAWMTLCDSRILARLARMSGLDLAAVPATSLVKRLFETQIDPEDRVLVVGGDADMIRTLRGRYALSDIRWHDAPANLKSDPKARSACSDFIVNNPARWIFLAVGSPQQEMIAHEVALRGDAKGVGICCGASLDLLTGQAQPGPAWMRRFGLERLHRLGRGIGRRCQRYLVNGPRIVDVWLRWRRTARG